MKLIKCPECIYIASDKAKFCPICGNPLKEKWSDLYNIYRL